MIPVTKPFLPPLGEYQALLEGIWQRNWLTNNGPLVVDLEIKLKNYLGIKQILYVNNGTIALQIALKALNITKEVITTPFSYVATTSSIVWEGCKPIYVDIDVNTFNIDPIKIEAAITTDTQAILATHCFGNPCDIDAIDAIAKKHGLKVIYDAAHCFGTMYKGKSVFDYGDISTASFHATKLFHTIEGGALITHQSKIFETMSYMRNFGHDGPERFHGIGINGKNSEFHAAMGLVNIKYVNNVLANRKVLCNNYDELLVGLDVKKQQITFDSDYNFAYYPIVFRSESIALEMKEALESHNIFARRYFYPSLSHLPYTEAETPISDSLASRILCLPFYDQLSYNEQKQVSGILLKTQDQ